MIDANAPKPVIRKIAQSKLKSLTPQRSVNMKAKKRYEALKAPKKKI